MTNAGSTWVGRDPVAHGGRSFPGALDELQIYDEWVGEAGCAQLFEVPAESLSDSDGDGLLDPNDNCGEASADRRPKLEVCYAP